VDLGVVQYSEWRLDRITLPDGRFGVVCYFRDIADQVRAREALHEADRRKDEFLAMLSHELRSPLGAIGSAVRLLREAGESEALAARAQAVIDRQVAHLTRLVDDLLDVSRVTTGRIALDRHPIDLAEVASGVVNTLRTSGRLDDRRTTPSADSVWVDADETRLAQIVSNLVGNALKFTPKTESVTVRVRRDQADAVLEVEDSGIGIPADQIDRIFDLFVQGEQS